MSWDAVSYVIRSKVRKGVLIKLESPKTPTILAHELHTSMPNISRALHELLSKELVECITPKARVGKIYRNTRKGKETLLKIKQMEGHSSALGTEVSHG